jgi:ACS family tartrate transporter-like MFS transporter
MGSVSPQIRPPSSIRSNGWIARILITWGIISGLTAFLLGVWSFYGIRFLLGLAEAGFYRGIILYLTWWFPCSYRLRIIGTFMTAIPISIIVGSIVSSQLLLLDGFLGLQGWQWLFILEAFPSVILGVVVIFYLTDGSAPAKWLRPDQQQWHLTRLAAERAQQDSIRHYGLSEIFLNPRIWLLTLVYFGQNVSGSRCASNRGGC